jgi:hypothetical protein
VLLLSVAACSSIDGPDGTASLETSAGGVEEGAPPFLQRIYDCGSAQSDDDPQGTLRAADCYGALAAELVAPGGVLEALHAPWQEHADQGRAFCERLAQIDTHPQRDLTKATCLLRSQWTTLKSLVDVLFVSVLSDSQPVEYDHVVEVHLNASDLPAGTQEIVAQVQPWSGSDLEVNLEALGGSGARCAQSITNSGFAWCRLPYTGSESGYRLELSTHDYGGVTALIQLYAGPSLPRPQP